MAIHKALIPFDGSDFSRQVLSYVCSLLSPQEFNLTLFRVAPVPQGYPLVPQRPLVLDAWMLKQAPPVEEHPIYASQVWESFRSELMDDMADEMEDLRAAQQAELEAARKKAQAAQAKLAAQGPRRARRKPQAQNAIRLLQEPETAQQAIIASVILGKPKGLN